MVKFTLILFAITICWLTLVSCAPASENSTSTSTTSTKSTTSTTTTSTTTKAPRRKNRKNVSRKKNGTSTRKAKSAASIMIDAIEITPEFIENTMNEYSELSNAYYDDTVDEATREKRTLRVFNRLREGAQSGVSLLRSLFPSLASLPFFPSTTSVSSSSSSGGAANDDPDAPSTPNASGGIAALGGRFLTFARGLLRTMFNFLMTVFRMARNFISSRGGIRNIFRRPTTTTESPDYGTGDDDSSSSNEADSSASSGASSSVSDSSSGSSSSSSEAAIPDVDIRENYVEAVSTSTGSGSGGYESVAPFKPIPPTTSEEISIVPFKNMPSFPSDDVKYVTKTETEPSSYTTSSGAGGGSTSVYGPPEYSSGYSGSASSSYDSVVPQSYSGVSSYENPYNHYVVESPSPYNLYGGQRYVFA